MVIKATPVHQYTIDGEYIKTWESIGAVGRAFLTSPSNIANAIKQHRKTFGYIWKRDKINESTT